MGSYLPALQQVSERDPLPLAKTCSSCQSTPCGPHVVGRQMDSDFEPWFFTFPARPSDSLPAHHPTHSIGSNCRYAELSVKSTDTNDVLGPLGRADIQRPESHSPGELGSGRPSGLFKRRSIISKDIQPQPPSFREFQDRRCPGRKMSGWCTGVDALYVCVCAYKRASKPLWVWGERGLR